jgi:hypothetical protein
MMGHIILGETALGQKIHLLSRRAYFKSERFCQISRQQGRNRIFLYSQSPVFARHARGQRLDVSQILSDDVLAAA